MNGDEPRLRQGMSGVRGSEYQAERLHIDTSFCTEIARITQGKT